MATGAVGRARLSSERLFYGGMGLLVLLLVFAGFAPTYFLRGTIDAGRPLAPMTPLIHLHGIVFSAWILLFVAQTALISSRRHALHRTLGGVAMGLAVAMIVLGVLVAVHQAARGSGPPGIAPLTWAAVPLFDIPVFAILVGAGYHWRRDAQTHKRLMLLATVMMLQPAIGRMPVPGLLNGEFGTLIAFLMVLPLVVWDFAQRGRLHPASAYGIVLLAAEHVLRLALWETAAWQSFAGWLVGALT